MTIDEELKLHKIVDSFILSTIASSPGFESLSDCSNSKYNPNLSHQGTFVDVIESERNELLLMNDKYRPCSLSTNLSSQTIIKALRIVDFMKRQGFRPITSEEYISEIYGVDDYSGDENRNNNYNKCHPILIWRPSEVLRQTDRADKKKEKEENDKSDKVNT